MRFQTALKQGFEIVKLNRAAMQHVSTIPEAFTQALIITALAGVASLLTPHGFTPLGWMWNNPIAAVIKLFIFSAILHFMATVLGHQGDFMALFRVLGLGRVLGVVLIVPFIGGVVNGIWGLVIAVIALEELYQMERMKAVLCLIAPIIAFGIISAISGIMNLVFLGSMCF